MEAFMKKKIKIDFVDFWPDLIKENNYFTDILQKYYEVEISSDPDYVFCSYFDNKHLKYQDCIKIFFIGENMVPDFNLYDYAMGFHYISFEDRYLRLPLYALYTQHYDLFYKKHTYSDEYYLSKKKFCNRVVSNPFAMGERDIIYLKLSEYKKVDSGGKYRNNVGGPVKDKIAFEKDYRFTLAFENSAMSGYTTEKILQAFAGDTIHIYMGSERIAEEFNPESFITGNLFKDAESLIEEIKRIDNDEEAFLKMIKAPAVLEGSQADLALREDYIDDFLKNIFDQDKEKAKRRSMVYLGMDYQKKLKDAMKVKKALDVVKRPIHLYHGLKWQLTTRDR
jgi:hypothetical protein